jgi:proline racemase
LGETGEPAEQRNHFNSKTVLGPGSWPSDRFLSEIANSRISPRSSTNSAPLELEGYRLAVLKAQGLIGVGETFIHESVIGAQFGSRIDRLTTVGPYEAVVPRISGQAYITEISQVGLDPADPFPTGYVLSDTWPSCS